MWIVSDVRRKTDIQWFEENYSEIVRKIRITADDNTRKARGYNFQCGVDDVASECDLDDYNDWDLVINNGDNGQSLEDQVSSVLKLIKHVV